VLVLVPGSGDSIQALKAGVMEIPDIIVVNKADHPLTDTMVREIRGVLSLSPRTDWRVPIVKTEAVTGEGVDVLATRMDEHHAHIARGGGLAERRRRHLANEVVALTAARLRRHAETLISESAEVERLLNDVAERRLDPATVASVVFDAIVHRDRPPAS
jgi:LAO/AO transport system kinase